MKPIKATGPFKNSNQKTMRFLLGTMPNLLLHLPFPIPALECSVRPIEAHPHALAQIALISFAEGLGGDKFQSLSLFKISILRASEARRQYYPSDEQWDSLAGEIWETAFDDRCHNEQRILLDRFCW
ncbi:zinc finger mynd domain-containing protein [Moniliophthora roreri]|nr:zinc finger mynd domain-containing protein [Moniliophthora roreri]